ncbi:26S proteasome non-ATPase regulatory subunit 11-like protein, partial [Mucuna pruriens]
MCDPIEKFDFRPLSSIDVLKGNAIELELAIRIVLRIVLVLELDDELQVSQINWKSCSLQCNSDSSGSHPNPGSRLTTYMGCWALHSLAVVLGRLASYYYAENRVTTHRCMCLSHMCSVQAPMCGKGIAAMSSFLPATTESIALAIEAKDPSESISILYRVLDDPSSSPEALRMKEQAITNLTEFLRKENRAENLRSLLTQLRPFFSLIPKAKTAKIVRGIIDTVAKIPGTSDLQIALCKEMVQWTRDEKRTFLRQRVEARLAALLMENKEYSEALTLLNGLIKEVRRLDDKLLLVDIDLLESKLHFSLRNLPKAKAGLTAARTAANAIYVPPAQQGAIDLQSGILHAEEKDYKTAYSYFYEAFESFNALEDPKAVFSLKYMLLCKIMVSQADDVAGIISSKAGLQYVGPDLDAMKAVADAHSKRSLNLFEIALRDYKAQLEEDAIVHRHLSSLYDTLLEQNLCRLIEPFSRVEIAHIAELIELPVDHVERKLSQLILDKKFAGTLDQGAGCLVIFDDPKTDAIYPATLETISNVGKVVDSLYVRSAKIMT